MSGQTENLASMLSDSLPVALRHIPERIRDVSLGLEMRTAVVGGIPRDLLRIQAGQLAKEQFSVGLKDFDIAVEGDGIRFAYELARRIPGKLTLAKAFRTANLLSHEGLSIDIATTRNEHYEVPGQLPEVDTFDVSLEQDQLRRDFSVNAVAIELGENHGRLIDSLGGYGDIRDQIIRVLHPASFSDDPTRLLRSLRYAVRFGYDLEPVTLQLYQSGVDDGLADLLTPERIRYELECISSEERWIEMWAILDLSGLARSMTAQLGGISRDWQIEDAQALDIAMRSHASLLESEGLEPWLMRCCWALRPVASPLLEKAAERIGIFPRHVKLFAEARRILRSEWARLAQELRPSQVSRVLEHYPRKAILVAMLSSESTGPAAMLARRNMLRYLEEYSTVRSELTAEDLIELGAERGQSLRLVRDELRWLRLDGVITSREAEMNFARKLIKKYTMTQTDSVTLSSGGVDAPAGQLPSSENDSGEEGRS